MNYHAVITGDIVDSRKVAQREELLGELKSALNMIARNFHARYEIFRGDSFQAEVPDTRDAMLAAILLRAHLRAVTPSSKPLWDVRASVGVGRRASGQQALGEAGGEAFELSGLGLEKTAGSDTRLSVWTPSARINEELALPTRFADDIISNWSHYSAEIAYYQLLLKESQSELGKLLGKKQPTIHARLTTAKIKLIEAYIDRVGALFAREFGE